MLYSSKWVNFCGPNDWVRKEKERMSTARPIIFSLIQLTHRIQKGLLLQTSNCWFRKSENLNTGETNRFFASYYLLALCMSVSLA